MGRRTAGRTSWPVARVCDTGDDRPLGKIALRMPDRASPATSCAAIRASDQPVGELSYWVLPEARGRGVASAAVGVMLDRARQAGGVRSVVLDIGVDNIASLRIAQRLGADRRQPERAEVDRQGVAGTMVVFVIQIN